MQIILILLSAFFTHISWRLLVLVFNHLRISYVYESIEYGQTDPS